MNPDFIGRDLVIGSLFTGYAGLDHATISALLADGARSVRVAWVADNDPGAARILAHRSPATPNLGDITAVDWTAVEPVDVVAGGFPCQDVSLAGARAGLRPDTRSGLWAQMAYAVSILRPELVVAENVRGLLSASAHSDVEPCPWCLGDTNGEPPVRALGAVLADMASIGYDARWQGLRASDVGAPHARFRVFIAATDANRVGSDRGRVHRPGEWGWPEPTYGSVTAPDPDGAACGERGIAAPGQEEGRRARSDARRRGRAPVADAARDGRDEGWPEPAGIVGGPDAPVGSDAPTPDADGSGLKCVGRVDPVRCDTHGCSHPDGSRDGAEPATPGTDWGDYGPAVRRWGRRLGRPAPSPTEPGRTGDRLSPRFVEWMMGLPDGWVTDVPGLKRNDMLKSLGNGVVPQQAERALRMLLSAGRAS